MTLEELEQKAKAATPGPWTTAKPAKDAEGWQTGVVIAGTPGRQGIWATPPGGSMPYADQQHIAANSPTTTLALIARIRELEAMLHRMLASAFPHPVDHPTMTASWTAARALLAKGVVLL